MSDDDHSLDLFWNALNYRGAPTENAQFYWLELERCVKLLRKAEWLAAMEHAEIIVRARDNGLSCCDSEAAHCADAIKRAREG